MGLNTLAANEGSHRVVVFFFFQSVFQRVKGNCLLALLILLVFRLLNFYN